jgi:hypothetical protein
MVSEYKFSCPRCQQSLKAPQVIMGRVIDCPTCKGRIQLPSPKASNAQKSLPPPLPTRPSSAEATFPAVSNFAELQRVSNYRLVRKTLKPAGIGSIVFGLIAIAMGFGGMEENPANAILGLIGLFLLVEGIWIVSAPTPIGMIVDGIALLILGSWNIFTTITNSAAGGGNVLHFFAILGVWQIIWGFQSFGRYRRFSAMPMVKPSDETLRQIDDLVNAITKAKAKEQPDLVEFQTTTFTAQTWKGRLSNDSAVFVEGSGQDIVFARRGDVEFVKQGKALIGKTLKATFKLRDRQLTGTIAPEFIDRFEAWKAGN